MRATVLHLTSEELRRNDLSQLLAGFLALLALVLFATWPEPQGANDSWYALAQTRLVALLLLGMHLGASCLRKSVRHRWATLLAFHVFLLLTLPLDLASYAASFAEVPWVWAMAVTWVDTLAFFGVGFMVARTLGRMGQGFVLALVLMAIFGASLFSDVLLGRHVFQPIVALTNVSSVHLTLMGLIALLGTVQLFRTAVRPPGRERAA